MKLAVVAYPVLEDRDRQWIESFRSKHDPQASRLRVHFTLVFPVEGSPEEIGPEIAGVARSTAPISFVIRRTDVVRDVLTDQSHLFLVPDEGGPQTTTLHHGLYAGALRVHLRANIPFVPHMTVAAVRNGQSTEALVHELGMGTRVVRGTVGSIDLIDVGHPRIRSVATYALRKSD